MQKDPNIISTRAENRPPRKPKNSFTSPLEQSKTATEHNLWSHRAHAQPMQTPCRHCRCKKTQTPCPNSQNVQTSRRAPPLRGGRRISIYHILIDGWMDTAPGYDGIFVLHFTDLWHVQPQALYIEAFLQCSHPNRWRISNQPFLRLGLWHLSADLWERSKKHPLCFFSPGIWWQPQRCRDVKQQDV